MTRKAARNLIALGLFGLALGAFGAWRAWQPGADGTSEETRAQRPALELVAPALGAGTPRARRKPRRVHRPWGISRPATGGPRGG